MKGRFLFAVVLAGLAAPPHASAKAPTARITISGGDLAGSIEVTDPRLLDISGWGGPPTGGVANEPPPGRLNYEVSFYAEIAGNDVRKNYVVFYYPGPSAGSGIIYRPGKGVLWGLNAGSVMRRGEDGTWRYASPAWDTAWDATARPALVRAKSAPPNSAIEVRIDRWTRPRTGWLYVVDPASESATPGSRVWLVDPEAGQVMGSVRAGYVPDIALSPDGSRLYIASGEHNSGELAVLETATGALRHVPFPDRVRYNPWYEGLPLFSSMAMDPDGRTLWILGPHVVAPDQVESRILAFDTRSETFLAAKQDFGVCGFAELMPSPAANQFAFLCEGFGANSNHLHLVQVDAGRQPVSHAVADLPRAKMCGLAEAFFLPVGNRKMAIIGSDGAFLEVDMATQEVSPNSASDNCSARPVARSAWPRSPDGARLYLGYGGRAPDGMSAATELRVFDTASWRPLETVRTSVRFWSAVVGRDGRTIYAAAPADHSVLAIEAVGPRQQRAIRVGNSPALILVAP